MSLDYMADLYRDTGNGFNVHGVWVGETEKICSPDFGWKSCRIEIARTFRGYEYTIRHMCEGSGIGSRKPCETRDEAFVLAISELRLELDRPHDRLNGADVVPKLRKWLDGLMAPIDQPSLFAEAM